MTGASAHPGAVLTRTHVCPAQDRAGRCEAGGPALPLPAKPPASALLGWACSTRPAFPLQPEGACSQRSRSSHTPSASPRRPPHTLPRVGEERSSSQAQALGPLAAPAQSTPPAGAGNCSDNAQRRAHFHKYKAGRVGRRGRRRWGCGLPPLPGAPSPAPSTQRLWSEPPLSTCSQNSARCPPLRSPGNELGMGSCQLWDRGCLFALGTLN